MKERTKMCNKLITSDDIHFLYPRLHRLDKPETSIMKTLKTNLIGHSYKVLNASLAGALHSNTFL